MLKKRILIVMSFILILNSQLFAQKLRVITEEWPPYNFMDGSKVTGFSTEVVQAIMKETGENYEIELMPGARGEDLLENGSMIMNYSLFRTASRENKFKWIGPIAEDSVNFFYKADSSVKIRSIEDAKKLKAISSPHRGLVYNFLIERGFDNLTTYPTPSGNIQAVLQGRSDYGIGYTNIGISHTLKQLEVPLNSVVFSDVVLVDFPLYIACTKDVPDSTINKWQKALDKIKKSGEFDEIYMRYLGK